MQNRKTIEDITQNAPITTADMQMTLNTIIGV